ncbi:MAG: hypothetical protein Roseis2KO_10290 [Roseivirga sp.]
MTGRTIYSFGALALITFYTLFATGQEEQKNEFPELVKISLREVGNQLLLAYGDSTSAIPPVVELDESQFKLSFGPELSFMPNTLVEVVREAFQKADLPRHYIVEVTQCADAEVAYSYKMTTDEQTTIIPCAGRFLPVSCYTIMVRFTSDKSILNHETFVYTAAFSTILLLGFLFGRSKLTEPKREGSDEHSEDPGADFVRVGSFQFYPEQNKLVREASDISLSRKECELLEIFVASPNQTVRRDELTKKVWEDNGVIVGRSLDTYISKLRKKLKADESIRLTNVHGVGYKLEVRS